MNMYKYIYIYIYIHIYTYTYIYIYIYIYIYMYICIYTKKTTQFNRSSFHFLRNLYQVCLITCLANILKDTAFQGFVMKTSA